MSKMNFPKKLPVKQLFLLVIVLCCHSIVFSQETTIITGVVADSANNTPLVAASVLVKGTTKGTTTDANGRYSITASPNSILTFQSVGYVEKQISVGNQSTIDVSLSTFSQSLDQVVVVGYGTQKKTSLTAAISSMKGEDITSVPTTNLSNNLGGRVSGVMVKQGSGEPGRDGSSINIRGVSTTGSTSALIIVDGIPRSFQELNPNDIESITVLKDAAAVAPYGVAGANGVILVTTKRGHKGAPIVSYNGYTGFQNPTVTPKYVNGYEYALLRNDAAKNGGLPIVYTQEQLEKFKNGTDPDVYFPYDPFNYIVKKNQVLTNHSLDVSGGSEFFKYYLGLGYMYQKGMWPTTDSRRYNLTANLDVQATHTTKVSFNLNTRSLQNNYPAVSTNRLFELIGFGNPGFSGPLQYTNGLFGNMVMADIFQSGYNRGNNNVFYSQLSIEQDLAFIPGLQFKGTVAYDPSFSFNKQWRIPTTIYSIVNPDQEPREFKGSVVEQLKPSLNQSTSKSYSLTYQAGLTYEKSFGDHDINLLGLFEARSSNSLSWGLGRKNFDLYIDEVNMGSSSASDMSTSGSSSEGRQVGLVYRLRYGFKTKYLFEASGRYDGHYYFAPGKQFGFFPAFSIGWRISEEDFFKDNVDWVKDLKIRTSYGESGNLAGAPFQFLSSFIGQGGEYKYGNEIVSGLRESTEPNVNITWERSKKFDIGLDAILWNGLLNVSIDYFHEKRSNMLVVPDVITPVEYGIGLSQVNEGVMENKGIELSATVSHRFESGLRLSLGGNFSYAKNKLLNVFETAATYDNPNRRITGKPLRTQFGYRAIGFFEPEDFSDGNLKSGIAVQPWGAVQPGDIRYEDINRDGKINENDFVDIGYPDAVPLIIYGFSPGITYKNFSLDLFFQGAGMTNFYMSNEGAWPFFNSMSAFESHFDYWRPDNRDAKYPRLTNSPTANNTQKSSFWMLNTNYLRLKNATLAYSLNETIVSKLKMNQVTVYISGQNILTWSQLINFDPENASPTGRGYPQQKVLSFGLNLVF